MQHQSQGLDKGPTAGTAGIPAAEIVVTAADIERYVAEGKRMQAEAIATFLKTGVRRLGALLRLRPVRRERLSRA